MNHIDEKQTILNHLRNWESLLRFYQERVDWASTEDEFRNETYHVGIADARVRYWKERYNRACWQEYYRHYR